MSTVALNPNNLKSREFDKECALNLSQASSCHKGTSPAPHCEGPLDLLRVSAAAPKQLNLKSLSDAGGSQIQWLPTSSKTDFSGCLGISQNNTITHQLANWLVAKSSESSTASQIQYHLLGRVALLGTSLLSLAEAVGRVIAASIAWVGYLGTLGYCEQAKNFGSEHMQKASHAGSISLSCLCSITSPKEIAHRLDFTPAQKTHPMPPRAPLAIASRPVAIPQAPIAAVPPRAPLAPEDRLWRVREGAELIAEKLQRQFERAQHQAAQEPDGAFQYLAAPANFGGVAHGERVDNYEVGICHFIGRRFEMEDEHIATTFNLNILGRVYPVQLFGVFDGHGGNAASIFARDNFERVLHETLDEFCVNGLTDENIWNALKITCARLTTQFHPAQSGTTATVAMILDHKLWTANVGDSRTILDNGIQLSEDAKPTDPYYRQGIENRGGVVRNDRVNGILAVARAIGDHAVGAVNARPKITVCPLAAIPQGSHLVLTCDGVYDVASTRQVAGAVRAHQQQTARELARNIVYSAYRARSMDNLSALVVKL